MGLSACGAPNWTRPLAELLLVAIGKLGHGPEAELFAKYARRLRPELRVIELPDGRGSSVEIKRREAAGILTMLPRDGFVAVLDLGGIVLDSESFAARLRGWQELGRPVCFVVGGAEGLDASVLTRADAVLSLGSMTWPHMLVRTMLAEQVYRARTIAAGHPYHRAGRPSRS